MRPSFTLGIEEEYQTVDPVTRDLRSHIKTELLAKGKRRLEERVKAEMHQSVVEVGTRICRTITEAREYMAVRGTKLGVLAIDTLSASAPGADENSSKDMSPVLAALHTLALELQILVVVIAHTGKDETPAK